jgi:hypothetical protein
MARSLTEVMNPRQTSPADPAAVGTVKTAGDDAVGQAPHGEPIVFPATVLDQLLDAIRRRGFRLVGPVVKDGAICYDDIAAAADLPAGWTDEQDAASYRLRRRDDGALFGYAVGPHSWKKYLFPPSARLLPPEQPPERPFAFIGVRACELQAIAIQDRVFLGGQHADPQYSGNREGAFIVAVNCGQPGGTCFCASMGAGPRVTSGFDIALTELLDGAGHRFFAEAAGARGAEVLCEVPAQSAGDADIRAAAAVSERAAASMGRAMPELDLRGLLYDTGDRVPFRCGAAARGAVPAPRHPHVQPRRHHRTSPRARPAPRPPGRLRDRGRRVRARRRPVPRS